MDVFLTLAGMFVSVLLILVILLQRGRGGGLVGSLSGLGGQSAFGTKAGDTFTRITIVIAFVWVMLAGITGIVMRREVDKAANFDRAELKTDLQAPSKDGKKSDTSKAKETESDAADDADLKESAKTEANSGKGKGKEKEKEKKKEK